MVFCYTFAINCVVIMIMCIKLCILTNFCRFVDGRMSSRFGEAWCDHSATTTMTGIDIEAFLDLDLNRPYNVSEIFVKLPDDRQ